MALRAGFEPAQIVFTGVGKTRDELDRAVALGVKAINIESDGEADAHRRPRPRARRAGARRAARQPGHRSPTPTRTSPPGCAPTSSACPSSTSPALLRRPGRQARPRAGRRPRAPRVADSSTWRRSARRRARWPDLAREVRDAGIALRAHRPRRRPRHRLRRRARGRPAAYAAAVLPAVRPTGPAPAARTRPLPRGARPASWWAAWPTPRRTRVAAVRHPRHRHDGADPADAVPGRSTGSWRSRRGRAIRGAVRGRRAAVRDQRHARATTALLGPGRGRRPRRRPRRRRLRVRDGVQLQPPAACAAEVLVDGGALARGPPPPDRRRPVRRPRRSRPCA